VALVIVANSSLLIKNHKTHNLYEIIPAIRMERKAKAFVDKGSEVYQVSKKGQANNEL
jgi:hypothetical protein